MKKIAEMGEKPDNEDDVNWNDWELRYTGGARANMAALKKTP